MKGIQLGPHRIDVPGRGEADALTDWCARCRTPTQPAAVADEVVHGKNRRRYAIYRCISCSEAWLCSWAPPGALPADLRDRAQDRQEQP